MMRSTRGWLLRMRSPRRSATSHNRRGSRIPEKDRLLRSSQRRCELLLLLIAALTFAPPCTAVLRPQGVSIAKCAGWSVFSSLPQPLLAVPAYLFVDAFLPGLPFGIGFAAGAMVLMVFLELLPEAYEQERRPRVALMVSATFVAMILFQRSL